MKQTLLGILYGFWMHSLYCSATGVKLMLRRSTTIVIFVHHHGLSHQHHLQWSSYYILLSYIVNPATGGENKSTLNDQPSTSTYTSTRVLLPIGSDRNISEDECFVDRGGFSFCLSVSSSSPPLQWIQCGTTTTRLSSIRSIAMQGLGQEKKDTEKNRTGGEEGGRRRRR